ncbi:hypothetical protein TWF679_003598 [Orbilia oligospora]|uniref:NACHT domain-containing protein n=1 Tax=Orbilia oligospora TaxID=2813651 RepID=A0A8H8UR47_ORBOL|nr:hypothetical protein TWF679_003598 [Orbilia oligospora]
MSSLPNREYTIGWICALHIEMTAARLMLDSEHGAPQEQHHSDHNVYQLGSIGEHNIVIACLPDGVYGVTSAVAVAVGGFPVEKNDIRLGDIVVSRPDGTSGGVIQYDLGKAIGQNELQRLGSLNKPPQVLLNAVAKLRSNHDLEDSKVPNILSARLAARPRKTQTLFSHQGASNDNLYLADYEHSNEEENGSCESCNSGQRVSRPDRDTTDPIIHYGVIASGNQVIKHAITRDRIGGELGAVCFEMEAAGLMDNFPCLVIRGICDYSDSHKNDRWQRYAAAVAAATDILNTIQQTEYNRLLDKLPCAQGAAFKSNDPSSNSRCLAGTRVELLEQINEWFRDANGKPIFWLNGMAGTGKSTLARTIAGTFAKDRQLAASFFFKRGESERSHARKFYTTLAFQLAKKIPGLAYHIVKVMDSEPRIFEEPSDEQFDRLIFQPLSELRKTSTTLLKYIIVIDALDECGDEGDTRTIIHLLARIGNSEFIRVILTSRPELRIQFGFRDIGEGKFINFVLTGIEEHIIKRDIEIFFRHELAAIKRRFEQYFRPDRHVIINWPGEKSTQELVKMATPLFIIAATICRMLHNTGWDPEEKLLRILESHTRISGASEIERTYITVLDQLLVGLSGWEQKDMIDEFQEIIGTIINLATPLSTASLATLLGIPKKKVDSRLDFFHSVLSVPEDPKEPVRLLHLSFRDFLIDPDREERDGQKYPFWVNEMESHKAIATACLNRLFDTLHKDICGLEDPSELRTTIIQEDIDNKLQPDIQYACYYWVHHMKLGKASVNDGSQVHDFLKIHFLHWLEALSILGKSYDIILLIRDLTSLIDSSSTEALEFIRDAHRFTLMNRAIIDSAPLQLYSSALIFAPRNSIIRRIFIDQIPDCIQTLPTVEDEWDAVLQILHHEYFDLYPWFGGPNPGLIKFSPSGRIIAAAGKDFSIMLYDSFTGALVRTLRRHGADFGVVAFSPDGELLVSGSRDKTVRVLDSVTGALKLTLEGHESNIKAVSFSPDGSLIFSIASDALMQWDSKTGARCGVLKGSFTMGSPMIFSLDGQLLVSVPDRYQPWIWNFGHGSHCMPLAAAERVHGDGYPLVCLSQDGEMIAIGNKFSMGVFSTATGVLLQTLKLPIGEGRTCAMSFLPDSQLVALALPEAFDKSAIFTNLNTSLKIWSIPLGLRRYRWRSASISPDGKLLVVTFTFTSYAKWSLMLSRRVQEIRVYGSAAGREIRRLKQVSGIGVILSQALSSDNKLMASITDEGSVMLHDFETGKLLRNLGAVGSYEGNRGCPEFQIADHSIDSSFEQPDPEKDHDMCLESSLKYKESWFVRISRDGKRVAATTGNIVKVWDSDTGLFLETITGQWNDIWDILLAPDGGLVVIGPDTTIKVLESATGKLLFSTQIDTGFAFGSRWDRAEAKAAISPSNTLLAIAEPHSLYTYNLVSGVQQSVCNGFSDIGALTFSPDSGIIATTESTERKSTSGLLIHNGVKLYNSATGDFLHSVGRLEISRLIGLERQVAIAFAPAGDLIATVSSSGGITLLDPRKVPRQSELSKRSVLDLNVLQSNIFVSPDGKLAISVINNGLVELWDVSTGVLLQSFWLNVKTTTPTKDRPPFTWFSVVFSIIAYQYENYEGGYFGAISDCKTKMELVSFLDCTKKETSRSFRLSDDDCMLKFSPDSKLLAVKINDCLHVWDILGLIDQTAHDPGPIYMDDKNTETIVSFPNDLQLARSPKKLTGGGRAVRGLGRVSKPSNANSQLTSSPPILKCSLKPKPGPKSDQLKRSNRILVAKNAQINRDIKRATDTRLSNNNNSLGSKQANSMPNKSIPIEKTVTSSILGSLSWVITPITSPSISLEHPMTPDQQQTDLRKPTRNIKTVAFSPDGELIALASTVSSIEVWNIRKRELLPRWPKISTLSFNTTKLAFSPDGKLLLAYDDGVEIWSICSGDLLNSSWSQDNNRGLRHIEVAALSPDNKLLATTHQGLGQSITLRSVSTGKTLGDFDYERYITKLSFSRDGLQLKTNDRIWDIEHLVNGLSASSGRVFQALTIKNEWISRSGKRVIWLPHRYRVLLPNTTASCEEDLQNCILM